MGVFYAPSQTGECVLAMCSDNSNRRLITADTAGQVRVWTIDKYCVSTVSPVPFESSTPPIVHSWQAHLSAIVFCEWTDCKGQGDFVLTGATDHTARLWTIAGEEIGIFGQRHPWDIAVQLTNRSMHVEQSRRQLTMAPDDNDEQGSISCLSCQWRTLFHLIRRYSRRFRQIRAIVAVRCRCCWSRRVIDTTAVVLVAVDQSIVRCRCADRYVASLLDDQHRSVSLPRRIVCRTQSD
jgi:WD40 repeat protein